MKGNRQNLKKNSILFATTLGIVMLAGVVVLGSMFFMKKYKEEKAVNIETQAETENKLFESVQTDRDNQIEETIQETEKEQEDSTIDWNTISKEEPEPVSGQATEEELPPNTYRLTTQDPDTVTLVFAGDILLDESYSIMNAYRKRENNLAGCISPDVLDIMKNADIMMLNNEFTYTDRGEPLPDKAYTFRAKPESVSLLDEMGVDIVSIANNHISDYGEVSLLDTLDTLEAAGIQYVGAGRNIEEASKVVYYQTDTIKIGILSATQIERLYPPDTKGATEDGAGTFRCLEPELLIEKISSAKKTCDFLILYIHWGTENTDVPDWLQTDQAPLYAEAGADLIVGDHSHCLQPVTYSGETPVIYSLGNFWFNSKNLDTCMMEAEFTKDGVQKLRMIPCKQAECKTSLLSGDEAERVIGYLSKISPNVVIDEEGMIRKK